jgi:hypothetical protein
MLLNGPVLCRRNLIGRVAGTSRRGQRSLDPGDRLKLRMLTVQHRDRLDIESATPKRIHDILAEYAGSQEDAGK